MALTEAEQSDVITYLGYSARTIIAGSTDYSTIVHGRILGLPAHVESRIKKYLKKIRDLDTKIEEASERVSAESIEGFKLNPNEIPMLKGIRRTYIKELGVLLDIPARLTGSMGHVTI